MNNILYYFIDSLQNNRTTYFRKRFRSTDILIIEDIEFLHRKNKLQEELLNTVKGLLSNGGKIIFTSSLSPDKIQLGKDLLSVLDRFCLVDIEPLSVESKLHILNRILEMNEVIINEEV